jgi:hypothetical protein
MGSHGNSLGAAVATRLTAGVTFLPAALLTHRKDRMTSKKPAGQPQPAAGQMVAGWAERIAEAQSITHVTVDGKLYPRRAYGPDHPHLQLKSRCRDCGVALGRLHVITCCVERCAVCGGQAYGCMCLADAEEVRSH